MGRIKRGEGKTSNSHVSSLLIWSGSRGRHADVWKKANVNPLSDSRQSTSSVHIRNQTVHVEESPINNRKPACELNLTWALKKGESLRPSWGHRNPDDYWDGKTSLPGTRFIRNIQGLARVRSESKRGHRLKWAEGFQSLWIAPCW